MNNKHTIFAVSTNKVFRKDLAALHQSTAKATKRKLYAKIDNIGSEMAVSSEQLGILLRFGKCALIQALEYEGLEGEIVYFLKRNVLKILIL